MVFLRIAIIVGILLGLPVILYQMWAFVAPGLMPHERRAALPWIPMSVVFFLLGCLVAWVTLPYAVGFLLSFQIEGSLTALAKCRGLLRLRDLHLPDLRTGDAVPHPARLPGPDRCAQRGAAQDDRAATSFSAWSSSPSSSLRAAIPSARLCCLARCMRCTNSRSSCCSAARRSQRSAAMPKQLPPPHGPRQSACRHRHRAFGRRQDRRQQDLRGSRLHRR